ncbi:MAG: sigma-54-dependent Fis family transcriptional regulator [Bacteroidetes bacterium]|nr:sigma-54-dependent Fis family transcriptional regulator [Bacteroidota bacterium]
MSDPVTNKPDNSTINVLIVDDEKAARYGMIKALRPEGFRLAEAEDALSALNLLSTNSYHIVISDVSMPGMNGIELVKTIRDRQWPVLVIMITAHGSEKLAVEAIKSGAFNYMSKPYDIEELRAQVHHAAQQIFLLRENEQLRHELQMKKGFGHFVGESKPMQKVYDLIDKVSRNIVTVLIRGESGTGKEMVARTIHERSPRSSGPFVSLNCAALPKELIESELFGYEKGAFTGAVGSKQGKFEIADKGTIFLDEIGDMSLETQAKVLRVIQERKFERVGGTESIQVDVRILSATHRDLEKLIRAGQFREDLYYRLNVVEILLPALKKRPEDIILLSRFYLDVFSERHHIPVKRFSQDAMKTMMDYDWPGNVRELINVVERCVVLSTGEEITRDQLPSDLLGRPEFGAQGVKEMLDRGDVTFQEAKQKVVRSFEREFILEAMRLNEYNISQTAVKLGMKRQYLQQKIKELELNIQEVKENG